MDPTRSSHPILSYVLARVPTLSSPKAASPPDLEQPPVHSPSPRAPSAAEFELVERMPGLRHPSVLAAMSRAVSDVASGRLALRQLGPRPDHELVDSSRSLLAAAGEPGPGVPQEQVEVGRAVLRLDETHEAYEALLQEAEARLERVYRMAMQGKDLETEGRREEEASGEAEEAGVDEEVVRVLKLAEEGKDVETVCLADRQLRHLPDAFGRVRGLLVLDVSRNQLQVVPDAIGGLDSLEELRLASNALVALPDSIGLLSNLKILDVSGNKLRTLPDSISKCRSLVELDASYNVLTYLPTNIGYELVNLRKFRVYLNKLRSLPSSVCEMRSLCLLDAHFNELGGLPPAIGKLTSLETLNLGSNFSDMKGLPSSFGDLLSLRELDLSNNQIHALPDTFGRLDKLERLNLDQNPLVVPPMDVVHRGVEAVKECMAKRWHGTLLEEERKSNAAESPQASTPTAWLTRSVSSLSTWVSDVSGYLTGQEKIEEDPCLDQQL